MLELKKLSGSLNLDDPYEMVGPQEHVNARNIRFVNGQVQTVKGNALVAYDMPSGTNITIGDCYDFLNQRIFFFNYNSNFIHGIYLYSIATNSVQTLIINGAETDGDVLGFEPDSYFPDVRIIYGDDTQGDILYWLNSQRLPSKINIQRALGELGTYGIIEKTFLTVDKEIPNMPPAVVFEDDATITVNNFRKKLMKYKTRYVFDDKDKSAYSSHSVIPLPIGYTDTNADFNADPSKNARVAIVIPTGKRNVKKIEICACESLGNVFGDWFLIHVIDKEADGVDSETLTTYRFYNDQAYTYVDLAESEQEFDWVPQEANAQETLNGNVLAYGGILEGYNQITSDASAESLTEEQIKTTQFPFLFLGNQSGDSGFGTGEILVKIIGQMPVGWIFHIETTNYDITYTVQEDDTPTEVLAGLLAAAISDVFTGSAGDEDLLITKAGEVLQLVRVEADQPSNTELAVSIDWASGLSIFNFNGYADRAYLFPIGSDFTISNASNPAFNGTYHITSNSSADGIDLLLQTNTVVVPGSASFTGDVLSYPQQVTLFTLTGLSTIFYSDTSRIEIIGGSIYVTDFTVGQNITISGAGIGTFNRTYQINLITLSGSDLYLTVSAFTGTDGTAETVDLNSFVVRTDDNPYTITDTPAYDWSSIYGYGKEYFDYWGRSMGVITQRELSVQTIPYSDNGSTSGANLPKIRLEVNDRPPLEARYWQWVRTKNLTKSNFVQWISNATYKDTEFAYISIEILNQYIINNPQSSFLAWDVTPGDRIRFMKSLSQSSSGATYTDKDYEILASLASPYINGVLVEGQVLKIALPSTDADFDFGSLWSNYFIELYTPAKSVGNGLDVYYEFGERYDVGDAGLSTRFHQGQLQNQTPNLSQPAVFEFIQGDNYFAERTLNIGNVIKLSIGTGSVTTTIGGYYIGTTLINSYDVQDYIVSAQDFAPLVIASPPDSYTIKVLNSEYTFEISGQITLRIDEFDQGPATTAWLEFFLLKDNLLINDPISLGTSYPPFTDEQVIIFDFNTTVTRDAADGGFLIFCVEGLFTGSAPTTFSYSIVSGYITMNQTGQTYTIGMQNPNYSFFYESAVNANGRPWVVNPDGRQSYNMALMRYGLAYQQDTNINQVNRFYASQLDQYDRSKGDIRRFKFRQRQLRVFQSGGVGQIGVYAQFITNAAGATQLIYTSQIITPNNIQYYIGEHGMGIQNTSLVSAKNVDYFIDPVTGDWMRVSNDGMVSVSDLYKGQYTIASLLVKYNYPWYRADGSNAKIIGAYDYFDEQCVYVLQSGSRVDYAGALTFFGEVVDGTHYTTYLEGTPVPGDIAYVTLRSGTDNPLTYSYAAQVGDGVPQIILELITLINEGAEFTATTATGDDWGLTATTVSGDDIVGRTSINYINAITIPSYALSFNEKRNAFCSFYDFNGADSIMSAENLLYTFLNGNIYPHNSTVYCNFFGVQYPASVTLDFDGGSAAKKSFIALSYQANGVWTAPEIQTQLDTFGTTPQSSKLVAANINKLEGVYHASFLKDMNSPGGWINGYTLKGGYLVIKLVSPNDGGYYFINIISVKSIPSELNNT